MATYAIYFHDRCFYGLLVGMKPITIWYYHLLLYAHSFHKKSATLLICLVQIHVSALKWVFIVKNGLFKNVNFCFTRDRRRLEELLNFCNRLAVRNIEFLLKPEDKKLPIQQYNKEYIYIWSYSALHPQFTIFHFYVSVHTDVYGWVYLDPFFTPCNFCRDMTHLLLIIKRQ